MRSCVFSDDRKYRYTLWRQFYMQAINPPLLPIDGNRALNYLMVIGLNPSTADDSQDDPTIRRCIDYAKRWNFGALCMTNIFAWRDTDPSNMKKATSPEGVACNHHLRECAAGAGMILAAWGRHGSHLGRGPIVKRMLAMAGYDLYCLAQNKDGSPKHPLYLSATLKPYKF